MSSTTLSLAYSNDDSILAVGMSDTTVQVKLFFYNNKNYIIIIIIIIIGNGILAWLKLCDFVIAVIIIYRLKMCQFDDGTTKGNLLVNSQT